MGEIFTRLLDFSDYSWLNIISNEIPFSFDQILFVNEEVNLLLKKERLYSQVMKKISLFLIVL